MESSRPQVIFFDAVGTLFGIKGSVGQIYAAIAQQYGVEVAPQTIDWAFGPAFRAAGNPAFPDVDPSELAAREYTWWRDVAIATFNQADVLPQFADFEAFFDTLFHHFATATPWDLYDDTISTLSQIRDAGITLGVISNFDSRLYKVLEALSLSDFFRSITISTEVGVAKPDVQIFQVALQQHNCVPSQAWHIGDSLEEDYRAATTAGLRGIWLQR
ncbi:HAD family hydrolase [filamentous cyanobacterium LEGE 11480]|uniref:HAD family hydrolase n=1 Tax=Romeriopsis navalis LEGE 11480 TaxID=2777977 RepID=A0A928Z6K5_9CYAN|nr:HAD family hydrolase [Romeriopsis navalis]MBE9033107.1 HAD family hydrolase [Romeriopsis navalis LEGE 11480]